MVAQLIVSIGMHEHVERSAIQRQPTHDVGSAETTDEDGSPPRASRATRNGRMVRSNSEGALALIMPPGVPESPW